MTHKTESLSQVAPKAPFAERSSLSDAQAIAIVSGALEAERRAATVRTTPASTVKPDARQAADEAALAAQVLKSFGIPAQA